MRIYGPFHALSNPFVMASLGMQALSEGLQVYDRYEQQKQNNFLTASLVEGHPVTKLPGGPIRHFLSKTGLVSPDVTADGSTVGQELLALRGQQAKNIATLGNLANTREKVGPGPFQPGGPLAAAAQQFGGTPGMFAGPTPKEITAQQTAEERKFEHSPSYLAQSAAAKKQGELTAINDPANVAAAAARQSQIASATKQGQINTATSAANVAALNAAAASKAKAVKDTQLAEEASPLGARAAEARGFYSNLGAAKGKAAGIESTPLADLKDYTVYKRDNLSNVTQAQPNKPYGDFQTNQYIRVKTGSKADQAMQAAPKAIGDLEALRAIILANPGGIFPVAGNANALLNRGKSNWRNRTANPALNQIYSYTNDLIQNIKAANGGRVMSSEINLGTSFWPDPGTGVTSRKEGVLANLENDFGLDAGPADTQGDALRKVDKLIKAAKDMALSTASSGIEEDDDESVHNAFHAAVNGGSK